MPGTNSLIQQAPLTGGMSYGGILNYFDALMDDFDNVEYFPFGTEGFDEMNLIINAIGQREIAKQPFVNWFERQRQEVPFTVQGATAIASGQYTVTIPSSEIDPQTGNSWPIKGEIWRYAPTGENFQIVDKPASNTLVLRPELASTTLTLADGAKFFIVGNSQPEGSSKAQPQFIFDTLYSTKLQSIRNDYQTTKEAMYNQLWYSQSEDGKATPFSNTRDVTYMQREHLVRICNTFFAGVQDDNLSATTSFQTTPGLASVIFERGQLQDSGGDIDVTDFYALEAKLTTQDASVKDYMVWTTDSTSAQIEQNLQSYNQNVNIQLNKVDMRKTFWGEGAMADRMATTYSFNTIVVNNKNFGMTRMSIFDNPQTFGVTGSTWKQYAFVLPVSPNGGVDDGYGAMGKYIRLVHKPDGFMYMWPTGAYAPANKTDVMNFEMHIASEVGFKFIAANKYGLFYDAP